MPDADRIVADVAAAVGLREGEHGVRAVIAALARLEPVAVQRISRAVELPVPIVASVCGELRKRSVVAEERPARLTPAGRALFSGRGLRLPESGICPSCSGRGIVVPGALRRGAPDLAESARVAPRPRVELDQCHCTVQTKLRRVLALHEADALLGRRLLLLGDDDLTSLAILSVVRRFGSAETIAGLAVVDVDGDLIAFLERGLAGAPFPVRCVEHDLAEPLPPGLAGSFDTVVTDPPYTVAAARLFLSRAAEGLDGGGDVFLSFGSRRPGVALAVQRAITDAGFAIRQLTRDFNEYVGAGVLGGSSHLYHLTASEDLRPLVVETYDGLLYTRDG